VWVGDWVGRFPNEESVKSPGGGIPFHLLEQGPQAGTGSAGFALVHVDELQGSAANSRTLGERWVKRQPGSRSNAEQTVNELTLPNHIALPQPTDLPFPDRMHRLVSLDRSLGAFHRSKSQARVDPLLNEPVILFQDVIEVR